MRFLLLAQACLLFVPSSMVAQTSAEDCGNISDPGPRLSCYDMLFRESTESEETSGSWEVTQNTNPLDDSRTVTLVTQATEGRSSYGRRPALVIRCKSNQTELYINWQNFLGSDGARVTTRIASQEAESKRWGLSTDKTASFHPRGDIDFIKQLFGNDRLVAQVTPYNESPVTAIFDVSGLGEVIQPLRDTCNW